MTEIISTKKRDYQYNGPVDSSDYNSRIEENYKDWIHIKKYYYKNKIFSNYINFLIDYCIENDSEKCRQSLSEFLKN